MGKAQVPCGIPGFFYALKTALPFNLPFRHAKAPTFWPGLQTDDKAAQPQNCVAILLPSGLRLPPTPFCRCAAFPLSGE
jgi:hypothetical protein